MVNRIIALFLLSFLLAAPLLSAQNNDNPTIAILRFGYAGSADFSPAEDSLLNMLEAFGKISADERAAMAGRAGLEGENINIVWGDADFQFTNAAIAVDKALDQGADTLVTLSTPMTQVALNATGDMDDPPAIIFASVFNAAKAGIAESACEKPANVTGVEASTPYEEVLPLLLMQDPDLQIIGTILNPAEASGVAGAEAIVAAGEALGLTVEQAAVSSMADLRSATEGLINKGATIILLPVGQTTLGGLPAILAVAKENGVPVFHSSMRGLTVGATVGAGFDLFIEQGMYAGRLLVGYLNGDIDIANTAIHAESSMGIGVNLDSAADQGVEISGELMDLAGRIVEDGVLLMSEAELFARLKATGLPLEAMPQLEQLRQSGFATGTGAGTSGGLSRIMVSLLASPAGMDVQREFLAGLACAE